ncbi:hypothetical protein CYMTET_23492, partial [Cymbomonas tetramitiformis]
GHSGGWHWQEGTREGGTARRALWRGAHTAHVLFDGEGRRDGLRMAHMGVGTRESSTAKAELRDDGEDSCLSLRLSLDTDGEGREGRGRQVGELERGGHRMKGIEVGTRIEICWPGQAQFGQRAWSPGVAGPVETSFVLTEYGDDDLQGGEAVYLGSEPREVGPDAAHWAMIDGRSAMMADASDVDREEERGQLLACWWGQRLGWPEMQTFDTG